MRRGLGKQNAPFVWKKRKTLGEKNSSPPLPSNLSFSVSDCNQITIWSLSFIFFHGIEESRKTEKDLTERVVELEKMPVTIARLDEKSTAILKAIESFEKRLDEHIDHK